jgi:cytochrome c peroxidase
LIRLFTLPDNPTTEAKAKLGDKLFDDKRLSVDNTVACNTCDVPRADFTTQTETAKGVRDQIGKRNTPTVLNAMFFPTHSQWSRGNTSRLAAESDGLTAGGLRDS